jgi:invasion protein IalB
MVGVSTFDGERRILRFSSRAGEDFSMRLSARLMVRFFGHCAILMLLPGCLTAVESQPAQEIKAPPAAEDIKISFTEWTKACEAKDGRSCTTSKEGRAGTGQFVVAAEIVEHPGQGRVLRVTLPLGMSIKPGTRVIVDQGQPYSAPYVDCSSLGCSATYEASQDFISQLSRGNGLVVQGINGAGKPVSLVVPLTNFASALNGSPGTTQQPKANSTVALFLS